MIDSNVTKVNVEQIKNLISKLESISKSVNTNIKSYQKNLNTIEQAGYLMGVAEDTINISCEKISSICAEFDEYANKLSKELNEVIGQTQQIETEEKSNIEDIISQDPTTFNGTTSSSSKGGSIAKDSTIATATGAVVSTGAVTASGASSSSGNASTTSTTQTSDKTVSSGTNKTTQGVLANYSSPYSDTNVKNEKEVYAYLTEDMGLNDAAAAGVMANIYAESRFNPSTSGDSGTSYGMFQAHGGRKTNLISWCEKKGYNPSSVEGQMARFEEEITKVNDFSKTETALYDATDSVAGARNAASVMTTNYERPSNASSKAQYRADLAEKYYKQIKSAKNQ